MAPIGYDGPRDSDRLERIKAQMDAPRPTSDPFGYPTSAANPPTTGAIGCDECNRKPGHDKHWPVFTINYGGNEVCAKCLTPIHWPRAAP